jgi:N-acetylmuramoyl-L-alanine amidase
MPPLCRLGLVGALLSGAACTGTPVVPRPEPEPAVLPPKKPSQPPPVVSEPDPWPRVRGPARPEPLPPVPSVAGPLAIHLVYPGPTDVVAVEDSSFLLGSVGDGRAALAINGVPVPVAPNGAFLAWVRYPDRSPAPFRLVATLGADSAVAEVLVRRVPRDRPSPGAAVWIDTTSFDPRGRVWWPADEPLAVTVRAAAGLRLTLLLPGGRRVEFAEDSAAPDGPEAIRAFDRDPDRLHRPAPGRIYRAQVRDLTVGERLPDVLADPAAPAGRRGGDGGPRARWAILRAVRGRDTLRVRWPVSLAPLDPLAVAARLDDDPEHTGSTDSITVGRAHPGATYHWFFPTGTVARVTGRIDDHLRLGLAANQTAWVAAAEARAEPGAVAARPADVGSITLTPAADRTVVRIPVSRRVPYQLSETDDRLTLTLYDASADVNWLRYGHGDELVLRVDWRQVAADRVDLALILDRPVWGYRARWDGRDLLLEIRRPPDVDPAAPLAGRLIVVDPGHPPTGATGPTGLTEAEANLGIARELRRLLIEAGARVIMTRDGPGPVELAARPRLADSVGADVLVSIHNNALPDGVNPAGNVGSSVFYFQPQSLPLARAIQDGLARRLAVPVLGVARGDLALARPTWMPAVLVEGLSLIVPQQEAALRTADVRRRYAEAVAEGLADFLAARGRANR